MKKLLSLITFFLCLVTIPTNAATVDITYRYVHNGNVWYTETKQATVGEAYPELYALPQGVRYTNIPWGNVTNTETVDINCELTDAYLSPYVSETYESAIWCFLSIRNTTKHLQYENGKSYITVTTTSRPSNTDTSYQWAFVGNPLTGYKIMNKLAGSSKIMTSPAVTGDGGSTTPLMYAESSINTSTNNIFWKVIKREKSQGVLISRWNEDIYMSNYGGGSQMKFWTSVDEGSEFYITPVDQTYANQTLDTSKKYMLINRTTGKAMAERTLLSYWNNDISYNVAYSTEANNASETALWTLVSNNGGYSLKNYASNRYLSSESESLTPSESLGNYGYYPPALLKTNDTATPFYFSNADGNYYFITTSTATGAAEKIAVGMDVDGAPLMGTVFLTAAQWELREVTPETPVTAASSITSGNYYRLVNRAYSSRAMADTGGKVAGIEVNRDAYNQIWKITKNSRGSTYALQNALTGKYIQMNPGTSAQFPTSTTARYFTPHTTTSGGTTYFAFDSGNNGYNSLHCASSQSYFVVGWTYSGSDASYWMLENVTLTSEDLAAIEVARAIANGTGTNYTNQLSNFFSDYACTTLKSNYASMTDAQLRSAMSALPADLQEMAVRVKNDTWNPDATFNHYEKDFRIHNYEIYSNGSSNYWGNKTGIGPFAHLFNPTGIQAKAGDIVYIFVDANVKDSNATLEVEFVTGTNRSGTTKTLTRGYNAIYVNTDCELFISYLLNSTTLSCNDYPDIKIHIEGATCNGCFDMHRGHNNNDWAWLKENMFQNKYLHVKGNSVLLNVLYEGVKLETNAVGVMKIWDFIFDTEQSFAGCNQWKKTGQYKMMINSFHNENGGYPHWGSGNGTSHPNLTYTGVFNYNSLANGALWEVAHEIGHGHQQPINSAGTDESSNNVMSQIIQFLPKDHIADGMFQSAYATRNNGVKKMTERFNDGWAWFDYLRDRMDSNSSATGGDDNIANRWLFQLWMYFDYLGNYQPAGGNDGFAFVGALYDKLRAAGIGTSKSVAAQNDYLLMAKYCAEITQTDLDEFFEAWGFWRTVPKYYPLTISSADGSGTQNTDSEGKYQVGGYSSRNITVNSTTTAQIATIRNQMKSYTKKGGNIMFIEDRGVGCPIETTVDGLATNSMGDVGYYETFNQSVSGTYDFSVNGTTVTMSGGTGAVGFKIYDNSGNLVAISNMNTFSVPAAVATGLENGTYTMKVAQGDGTDIVATGEDTEPAQPTEQALYCIQSWRSYGFVKYNSDSEGITQTLDFSDANTKFYFLPVNGTNWEDGVKIVSNVSGKQLVDVGTGFADSGTTWYIKENPYKAGFYCISKTIDLSSGCWDCNGSGAMTASYWQPSANDNDGTSWQIVSADSLPQFQTSTLAEPKWYYIQSGRDNRYLYANGTSAGTSTSNAKTDAYKFAFIATTNNGIQVISKAGLDQGSNQYLTTDPGLSSTAATWYYYNHPKVVGYFMLSKETIPLNGYSSGYFGGYDGVKGTWDYCILHVNGSGGLTKWYDDNSGRIGNILRVEEVPEDAFEVTYNVIVNGNVVATGTQIHSVGDEPSMPAGMNYAFTTFTFNVSEITASTRTVQATATFNMPFETSTSYATAKWYYMNGHASYSDRYISTDGDATVYSQGKGTTDAYKWAFIGNPIEGIKVINKATGDGKYLQGTDPATMGATAKGWVLKQQTNTNWQSGANGFGLYEDESQNKYLNTQGSTLKYWGSFDQGSTFWVEEVPNNFAPDVVNEIGMFFADGATLDTYFTIPSATKAQWQALYDQYSVNATEAQYHEIVDAVKAAIVYPEAGRYRIKSCLGRYITCTNNALVTTDNISDQNTIFTFTGTYPNFQLSVAGKNVQRFPAAYSQQATVSEDEGNTIVLSLINPGYVVFDNYYNQIFFHEDASYNVVGWYANAEASHWTIEDVALFGDVDGNGIVEYADLTTLVNILLDNTSRTDGADVNGDGDVTLADLTRLVNIIRSTNE